MWGGKDRICWPHSNNGEYCVKSGYELLKEGLGKKTRVRKSESSSSGRRGDSSVWKSVWSLNIKHEVKFFMWKALQGILPTKNMLKSRIGKGKPICCVCGEGVETVERRTLFLL